MKRRRRFKQDQSLEVRLTDLAQQLRDTARTLPQGRKRDLMLRKARQNEMAADLSNSLRPDAAST